MNKKKDRKQLDLLPKIKLMFSSSELEKATQDLDQVTARFCRFTNAISTNRQSVEQPTTRQAMKLSKALRRVRGFANNLHQAISDAWRVGCHSNHEAKLSLEDRVEATAEILGKPGVKTALLMDFEVIFAASTEKDVSWHRAAIQVPQSLLHDEEYLPYVDLKLEKQMRLKSEKSDQVKLKSEKSEVAFSFPMKSQLTGRSNALMAAVRAPRLQSNASEILTVLKDICALKKASTHEKAPCALILAKHQQIATPNGASMIRPCDQADKITLSTLLFHGENVAQRGKLPLKHRMVLALRLASNLLQLSGTGWLDQSWSKENIYFLSEPIRVVNYASTSASSSYHFSSALK